jgi:UPF0755 protein
VRRWLVLAVALLLAAVTAAGAAGYWALLRHGPQYEVALEVAPGASASAVLTDLKDHGLLPSVAAGKLYVRLLAEGRSLHFGHYQIPANSRPIDVLEQLLDGRVKTIEVTIVEGTGIDGILDRFAAAGINQVSDWQEVIQHAEWVHDIAPRAGSLEGFLFPETYRFSIGISAETAAQHMVERFHKVWEEETRHVIPSWGTPLEVVTLASLVEAETSIAEERPRIAGVFLNRLRRGMLLQCDPTVVYALKQLGQWQGRLLRLHWQIDHPYNTYRYPGLPPGPINSPGREALRAAIQPESHTYLYFVANPAGGHTFSRSLREHNRAVARLQRSQR